MTAYYRCKAILKRKANGKITRELKTLRKEKTLYKKLITDTLQNEHEHIGLPFIKRIDMACKNAIAEHWSNWEFGPLVNMHTYAKEFEKIMPMNFAAICSILVSSTIKNRSSKNLLVQEKHILAFRQYLMSNRVAGKRRLTHFAKISTLSKIGKGQSVSKEEMYHRLMLHPKKLRQEMINTFSQVKKKQAKLIWEESEHKMRDKEIHDMFSTPLECIPNIVHDSNMEDNNEESNENDVNTNETNEKPMPKRYTLNIKCWSALCNHEWVKYKELLVRRNACRVKNAKRKLRHKAALVYYQLVLQRDAKLCKDMIGQIAMSQIATSDWPQLQPAPQSLRFSGTPQAVEAAKLTLPLQFHQYIWQHGSSMKLCGTRDCIFYAGHDDPEVGCSMHSNAEDLATATRKRKRRPPWFQQYIGRRVMKCFGTYGNFVGTVTEFDATNGFHIVYDLDKDDPEDLDKEGMRAILISHEEDQLYSQRQEYIQKMIVEVWGKPAAKQFQVQAILNIVQNSKNTLICHQTGSGKSLVALGAATILGGVTLVIIPLLSLGTDQLLLRYIRTVGTYTVMNITQLAKLITCFWN